ncbi:MAG: hypothetical protein ACR2PR_09330 [Pseudohongiellaceae bacterium]
MMEGNLMVGYGQGDYEMAPWECAAMFYAIRTTTAERNRRIHRARLEYIERMWQLETRRTRGLYIDPPPPDYVDYLFSDGIHRIVSFVEWRRGIGRCP